MKMKKSTVEAGELFAIPLEDGRFGVAQVLAKDGRHVTVIAFDYVGERPTSLDDARALRPLCEPSVSRTGLLDGRPTPILRRVSGPPPRGYASIGTRPVKAADARRECDVYSGWENIAATILIQWLRANHPKQAKALFARWEAERKRAEQREARAEKKRVAALTLDSLMKKELLPRWVKSFPKAVAPARKILRTAIRDFTKLEHPTATSRMAIVEKTVLALNRLDGTAGLIITTLEREELCENISDICKAAGWKTKKDVTEKWRDW